jgi:hypothetical protein
VPEPSRRVLSVRRRGWSGWRDWRGTTLVALAIAYSLAAAATTPFSWQADLVTAAPIGFLALAALWRWPWHPRPRPVPAGTHPYLPWLALAALVLAWELANYLARGPRVSHPTLSSIADAVDHHYLLKALLFFGWLCLGAWVVTLGAPQSQSASDPTAPGL